MFTGLVETTAKVTAFEKSAGGARLQLSLDSTLTPEDFAAAIGDSIAVNGCCLTVTKFSGQDLSFDLSSETLGVTNLKNLIGNTEVNIERAMRIGDRLGGHLVAGHVDGVGTIDLVDQKSSGWLIKLSMPRALGCYVIKKGSICLDGVSLTVNALADDNSKTQIDLILIPETLKKTTLRKWQAGQQVNIEVDQMAKFAQRFGSVP